MQSSQQAQNYQTGTDANAKPSPALRARNLRMRDWSASSSSLSATGLSQSASSSSLASINSGRGGVGPNTNHFRMAGSSIVGASKSPISNQAPSSTRHSSDKQHGMFLQVQPSSSARRPSTSSQHSMSSMGHQSAS